MLKNSASRECRRRPLRRISPWNSPLNRMRHFITLTLSLVSLDNGERAGSRGAPHHTVVVPCLQAEWSALKRSRNFPPDSGQT